MKSGAERGARPHAVRTVMYSTSPLLASKTPPWRSKFLVACIGLGFCLLVGRAVYIQIIGTDFYQRQGESRYARTLELPANRGRIIDRNGLILASSVPAPSIWAIPKDLEAGPAQRRELARLLGMTTADLNKRLNDNPNFVWLKRQVDESVGEQVKALGLKGVHQVKEYKRKYPEGEAAAHVVGFTNVENRGQEGIELAFQGQLSGRDGTRRVIKDRLGRVVEDLGESVMPSDGRDIELSIDSKVQFFAYQRVRDAVAEHKAKAGSVVVLDVETGEVLALANYPSYAPGDRQKLGGGQLRNRALTDTFEPGSTMKPFIASLAMDRGQVRPDTAINTSPGWMMITGSTIRDAHPHDILTVAQVIQKSSNVGTVKMAMQMPAKEMWEMFSSIGLGQRPQLPFPGVVSGRLRPYKSWRPIEQATMSYGYGLSASLFQLARAYTVFARDGELIPVSLVRHSQRVEGIRVFSAATARAMRQMLQTVCAPGGTAPKAQTIGYSVGGKSGTAHKQEGKGYAERKYRSWFVGLAPVDKPRIVVAVMVDEPNNGKYFGGDVAAPVFSEVVQQTLRMMGVQPDIAVQPQIIAEQRQAPAVEESF
ncbi:peptidoglycan D,D-transpeptidase FtsI family protein [Eleftheria terrae]|uniref:peptidoglycan D,D-transpeptidase FtsI family protein n=1 Tax=Eleftheria terrae TaxID=1597781 RepID=UPI00263BD6E1|nr:penicillin-binding protein 2 [Eleftheria terrae]WKB52107.1 penicillin-binding protein 2 [Eleftheria terrae]